MIRAWLCCLILLSAIPHARAADMLTRSTVARQDPSALCTAAIATAARRYAIPAGLLESIAKVESGRPVTSLSDIRAWPWTIDADGAGLFFDSKAQAVAWSAQSLARHVHYLDVGCMQVNLQAHPGAFTSLEDAFDPDRNADYAARYLRDLHGEANGDWNVAVGLYHSHTPNLAADYRQRVAQMGAGILTGIGGPEPLYQRALRQGTLRFALAGGGTLVLNTSRQPTGPRPHRETRCQIAQIMAPLLNAPPKVAGCHS